MQNDYSATWFELFLRDFPLSHTEREISFLIRQLPQPLFTTIADLCCGTGRHARLLAAYGYHVYGIDRSSVAIAEARRLSGGSVVYYEQDMRSFRDVPGRFDAVLNLWQSFGYFDVETNRAILSQIHDKLKPHGRLVLDVYHRDFFEHHQGTRTFVKDGVAITETKIMRGDRLMVQLAYTDRAIVDHFDWQLFRPEELRVLAAACGLQPLVVCADFDEAAPASAKSPRMQLVFDKAG